MSYDYREISFSAGAGGTSQKVSISSTSAQSAAITAQLVTLTVDTACFIRAGTNPTALSDGTDRYVPANIPFRVAINSGDKIAFKTSSASGNAYITPEV